MLRITCLRHALSIDSLSELESTQTADIGPILNSFTIVSWLGQNLLIIGLGVAIGYIYLIGIRIRKTSENPSIRKMGMLIVLVTGPGLTCAVGIVATAALLNLLSRRNIFYLPKWLDISPRDYSSELIPLLSSPLWSKILFEVQKISIYLFYCSISQMTFANIFPFAPVFIVSRIVIYWLKRSTIESKCVETEL